MYKIYNQINCKEYTGKHQTKKLNDGYLGSGKHLLRAISKYGIDNFEKEILFVFDNEEEMNTKEAELVTEEYCNRIDTYNLCPGGKGGYGYINSKGLSGNKTFFQNKDIPKLGKEKQSLLYKNEEYFSNFKKNVSLSIRKRLEIYDHNWQGKEHKQESKDKIGKANSISQSGSRNSQYGTIWITDGKVNKKIKKNDPLPSGFRRGRFLI